MEATEVMKEVAERVEKAANVRAAFGEPMGQGMDTVIPVARVSIRGGGGGGSGDAPNGDGKTRLGQGKGMGMGLNVVTAPVGYIKRTPEGAAYVPIVDRNWLFLAGAVIAGLG